MRQDLVAVARAGVDAADAAHLVGRAIEDPKIELPIDEPTVLISAGKAAATMASAFAARHGSTLCRGLVCATHRISDLPESLDWIQSGHPLPTHESVEAGRRALELAQSVRSQERLVVLLSGGASALLAVPTSGLMLKDKISITRTLLECGAEIHEINAVRKHLSQLKGGWLATASTGPTLTLAVSDVVGDDPSTIGSGPTVPDPTTFDYALGVIDRLSSRSQMPRAAIEILESGSRGHLPETPKPDDPRLKQSCLWIIGNRWSAMAGAEAEALRLGYHVVKIQEPVVGEARVVGGEYVSRIVELIRDAPRPTCVLSSGETTVRVTGSGRGGRNQEFALAVALSLTSFSKLNMVFTSIGTDGVDGLTDVAGAVVDSSTLTRSVKMGLGSPERFLDENDTYTFFKELGDLFQIGPTNTNVGDLQVALVP